MIFLGMFGIYFGLVNFNIYSFALIASASILWFGLKKENSVIKKEKNNVLMIEDNLSSTKKLIQHVKKKENKNKKFEFFKRK